VKEIQKLAGLVSLSIKSWDLLGLSLREYQFNLLNEKLKKLTGWQLQAQACNTKKMMPGF